MKVRPKMVRCFDVFCCILPFGRVVVYTVFMVFASPLILAKSRAKNLDKNLGQKTGQKNNVLLRFLKALEALERSGRQRKQNPVNFIEIRPHGAEL